MKWRKIYSINDLHQGLLVAFSTKTDNEKIEELWNEQFTVQRVVPNSEGKVEIWLRTKLGENLIIYWDEIDTIWSII